MSWENPKTNWGQSGQTVPIADDFNRIEGNILHLQDTKETPAGAQAKANTAEANAKAYTDAHEQKTAPHSGHETPAGAQSKVDNHAIQTATLSRLGHVNHAVLTATLTAASWTGTTSPYSQSVAVNGILATDTPIIDIVMSGTYSTDEARIEAWGYIYRAVTTSGYMVFYATEKPTVPLPIQIKVVR